MNLLAQSLELAHTKQAVHYLLTHLRSKSTLDEFKGYCKGLAIFGCQKLVDEFIAEDYKNGWVDNEQAGIIARDYK